MARLKSLLRFAMPTLALTILLLRPSSAQGTCDTDSPCSQGCCSTSGYCGFGPGFCGDGNCTSNCDAQAECGQYAPDGQFDCPLNVCCSQYGFCGTTENFCDSKCQTGCDPVQVPSCSGGTADRVSIGYYESWSYGQSCDSWKPENIDPKLWTHINYAFALIGPDYRIAQMNQHDVELYTRVTDLKSVNPSLKVYISVGGWSAGGKAFSGMVGSATARSKFIESALAFMDTFSFDGIDIDWEYPAAPDRDGSSEDTQNLVVFMKELKEACGSKFGVTATLPSSFWYLQGFDVGALGEFVDWFNFMSYDIHGVWDGESPYTKQVVQPHTNLTEIRQGLDLLWRNNVNPNKVVLGLAFYGRSFTLEDPLCTEPGCAFSTGGKEGSCTNTSGILSNAEIQRTIKLNGLEPKLDKEAAVKYMTWDSDQWVSYDDSETMAMKKDFANSLCLRGTMVWALDLADPSNFVSVTNLHLEGMAAVDGEQAKANPLYAMSKYSATQDQNNINLLLIWTDCAKMPDLMCPHGFRPLTYGHGKIFDLDQGQVTGNGCHGGVRGWNRALCIEDTVQDNECAWYGKPGGCGQGCPAGTILIAQNSHRPDKNAGCKTGHYASFCCKELKATHLEACPAKAADDLLSVGSISRVKQKITDLPVPFTRGTFLECNSDASDWQNVFRDDKYAGYVPQKIGGWQWQNDMRGRPPNGKPYPQRPGPETDVDDCYETVTRRHETTKYYPNTFITTCDYKKFSQACQHYSSVMKNPGAGADYLVCPIRAPPTGGRRPITDTYNSQHARVWNSWISTFPPSEIAKAGKLRPSDTCDRDEYPPFRFLGSGKKFTQWIRRIPAWQNRNAGGMWQNVCTHVKSEASLQGGPRNGGLCTDELYVTYTLPKFSMRFRNMPNDQEEGLVTNLCQPVWSLTSDPGFALLTNDPWYTSHGADPFSIAKYRGPIPSSMTEGLRKPRDSPARRWVELFELEVNDLVVDDGNTTRLKSEDEIWQEYGLERCQSEDCQDELVELGLRLSQLDSLRTTEDASLPRLQSLASTTRAAD